MNSKLANQRNFQLDYLKLLFTILVFYSHTGALMDKWLIPTGLGWISTHFFFIVSGLLMTDSFMKKDSLKNKDESGKVAMSYVLSKFRSLVIPYWVALGLRTMIQLFLYVRDTQTGIKVVLRMFPEIFAVNMSGILPQIVNGPTWYISAMLIVMLPLYYLMFKKTDFFIYIFAPLGAILTFGWMFSNDPHLNHLEFKTYFSGAIIRAFTGVCFGVVSWLIYNKIKNSVFNKYQRILITVIEFISWFIFFAVILQKEQWYVLEYSVMLLLPIAVAVVFTGQSYFAELFKFRIFKWGGVAPLSLAIYLNHSGAVQITIKYFNDLGYKKEVLITFILTMIMCSIYFSIIKLLELVWNRKLKRLFWRNKNEKKNC